MTKIYLSDGTTEEFNIVGKLDDRFMEKDNIVKVEIGDSVTSIGGYAFYRCSGLTSVTIPNSVTDIGTQAFCGCSNLTSVKMPDTLEYIGVDAFYACKSLEKVIIPDDIIYIGARAFENCYNLYEVWYDGKEGHNYFGKTHSYSDKTKLRRILKKKGVNLGKFIFNNTDLD